MGAFTPISCSRISGLISLLLILAVSDIRLVQSQSAICTVPSDVVFVVDVSGKTADNLAKITGFMYDVITNNTVSATGTHFAVVTFSETATVEFYLTQYTTNAQLLTAISAIKSSSGRRNLYSGLSLARTNVLSIPYGARADVQQKIIIITDGPADLNADIMMQEAKKCYDIGAVVFAVGITNKVDVTQLQQVSAQSRIAGTYYWTLPDYTSLPTYGKIVAAAACQPPKVELPACHQLDVVIALDIPELEADFRTAKDFLLELITHYFTINSTAVQVSLLTFDSTGANIVFYLNTYSDENSVKQAIKGIAFKPSGTADPTFALQVR
jgi:uncharacterized protein YegL